MKSTYRFLGLIFALVLIVGKTYSQYRLITLSCDSTLLACDTSIIEHYDKEGKLFLKEKKDSPGSLIHYTYDENGNLILKQHKSLEGEIVKYNRITRDSTGNWMTDSLIDSKGLLLTLFKKTPLNETFRYQVEWLFNGETKADTKQIIQENASGKEISNSTCYDNGSCITYLFHYKGSRKTKQELWILREEQGQPLLKETEEFYYNNDQDQPAGSIRFIEPEHRATDYFRYVKSYY